jgi:hypothetical protein
MATEKKEMERYIAIEDNAGWVTVYHVYGKDQCTGAWIMSDQDDLATALQRAAADGDRETNGWSGRAEAPQVWFDDINDHERISCWDVIADVDTAEGIVRTYPDACGDTGRRMLRLDN